MHPILFTIGSLKIHAWGVMVALGLTVGLLLTVRLAKGSEFTAEFLSDYALYALIAGLLGARIWEVIFSWQNFAGNPLHALMFWQGGLSIQGAVVANLLLAWWYWGKKKLSLRRFVDFAAPGLILGQAIGRVGCFLNGDAYGKPTGAWYGVVYQPGTPAYRVWGATPLVPAELFEGTLDIVILFILLYVLKRKKYDGQVALWYFVLYSLARFGLEFLRTDSLMIGPIKAAQLTTLLTAAIAGAILWYYSNRPAAVPTGKTPETDPAPLTRNKRLVG
ncbi:prolipoprotein diacylglyceryl transferase [Lucifera butyrica]|uniref:Phosphatidylglycerol--prolipoprotein diacylglyceryl transferase n=1 Tax=Lucifera butyrica TaxID=1351585 RepID=A0A498R681_9FIRM|nr:prolipoprotein diacylglyceryl transferase [Lucifera butyrica]VBB08266.1 prolipoprotein diacylglyceryl transferase [Lucifera butyrica]